MGSTGFVEIEHKYIVGSDFDEAMFVKNLASAGAFRQSKVKVRDTYFVLLNDRKHIYRHRYDEEIQQLTAKSIGSDAEVRTEINIPIDQSRGDQKEAIEAFLATFGPIWSTDLSKNVSVSYFEDCEVVFYRAVGQSGAVCCVEFEAVNPKSIEDGQRILRKYEAMLGFEGKVREARSLFELVVLSSAPNVVRELFHNQKR